MSDIAMLLRSRVGRVTQCEIATVSLGVLAAAMMAAGPDREYPRAESGADWLREVWVSAGNALAPGGYTFAVDDQGELYVWFVIPHPAHDDATGVRRLLDTMARHQGATVVDVTEPSPGAAAAGRYTVLLKLLDTETTTATSVGRLYWRAVLLLHDGEPPQEKPERRSAATA